MNSGKPFFVGLMLALAGASAGAATLEYVSSAGHMEVVSRATWAYEYDPPEVYENHYERVDVNDNVTAVSDSLSGGEQGVNGNSVSGTFSGLEDTSGFSMTGSLRNWDEYVGPGGNCGGTPPYCEHHAEMEREVRFTVSEDTTLYFTAEWSNLVGPRQFGINGHLAQWWFNLQPVRESGSTGNAMLVEYGASQVDSVSGQEVYSIDVAAGTYEASLWLLAKNEASSQPGAYGSIDATLSMSTIPVPAAVWLFASGLGLLGWVRRRANL